MAMHGVALRKEQPKCDVLGSRAALIFTVRIFAIKVGLYRKRFTKGAWSNPPLPWISRLAPERHSTPPELAQQ